MEQRERVGTVWALKREWFVGLGRSEKGEQKMRKENIYEHVQVMMIIA